MLRIAISAYLTCIQRPHWNSAMPFVMQKLEWCGYPVVKNSDDMFIRFDTTHERDGQTPHDGIGRAYA